MALNVLETASLSLSEHLIEAMNDTNLPFLSATPANSYYIHMYLAIIGLGQASSDADN